MTDTEKTAWDKIRDFFITRIIPPTDELQRLFPDSILFGALILYLLTSNMAFGVFSVFLTETAIIHKLIGFIFEKSVGKPSTPAKHLKCHIGFRVPRLDFERILSTDTYPSTGIFSMSAIAVYLGAAMTSFNETLATMGADWEVRYNVAIGFIVAVLGLFVITRYARSCDSGGEIAVALLFGSIVGIGLYALNKGMFGIEGMNFLGLPYLVNKDETEKPIYVCTPSTAG